VTETGPLVIAGLAVTWRRQRTWAFCLVWIVVGITPVANFLILIGTIMAERLLYLPQEITGKEACELLQEARVLDPAARGRLLSIVAALGVEPEALLESEQPSPGEARKLALASGLARQVWWLVLDEPTNHLDLPSIEHLERALADYPGAIVLATHDDRFARQITTQQLALRSRAELTDER